MPDAYAPLALKPVILASRSTARAGILRSAGLDLEIVPSDIEEAAVIEAVSGDSQPLPPFDVAMVLARAKAESVSAGRPGQLVIGADQTLELEGRMFTKPRDIEEARRYLLAMRGRTHALHSAVALAVDGDTVWSSDASAHLTMRGFTPQFLGRYLAAAGDGILESVGCYRLEDVGVQLFEHVEGDWFTILGLPLMPLLEELRRREALLA